MGQKTGLFLGVDNFATVNRKKAYDVLEVSELEMRGKAQRNPIIVIAISGLFIAYIKYLQNRHILKISKVILAELVLNFWYPVPDLQLSASLFTSNVN